MPIDLRIYENFNEAVARYKHFDLLIVNSIFDGMNLVAKEAPAVNTRDGVVHAVREHRRPRGDRRLHPDRQPVRHPGAGGRDPPRADHGRRGAPPARRAACKADHRLAATPATGSTSSSSTSGPSRGGAMRLAWSGRTRPPGQPQVPGGGAGGAGGGEDTGGEGGVGEGAGGDGPELGRYRTRGCSAGAPGDRLRIPESPGRAPWTLSGLRLQPSCRRAGSGPCRLARPAEVTAPRRRRGRRRRRRRRRFGARDERRRERDNRRSPRPRRLDARRWPI